MKLEKNFPLRNLNTYHIGGNARYFVVVNNFEELLESLQWAKKEKIYWFLLGNG